MTPPVGEVWRNPHTGAVWWVIDRTTAPGLYYALCVRASRLVKRGDHHNIEIGVSWRLKAAPIWRWYEERGEA